MTTFRVQFTDGDTLDILAPTPTAARDAARLRKTGVGITKVKKLRVKK